MANESSQKAAPIFKYNPQLDGLRFCAVLCVVCYHWLPFISGIQLSKYLGSLINFFFVLSSYLITGILFSAQAKGIKLNVPRSKVMIVFILRRTLRIFPAYYFFLLLVILLPTIGQEVRENAGMYFSYLSNYQAFRVHEFSHVTAHIWTLAVEEQFYVLWPLIILFIPHRHLLKTFLLIIICSVTLRAVCYDPSQGVIQAILTQYSLDAFALGGILAYQYTTSEKERLIISKYLNIALYILIPLGIIIVLIQSPYLSFVVHRLLFAVGSVKVIEHAIEGYKGNAGKFLENKVVLYLGKISYGIYLHHLLVPVVFWKLLDSMVGFVRKHYPSFFASHRDSIYGFEKILGMQGIYFFIYAALTVTVAAISWNLIEKPFMKMKVPYINPGKKPQPVPPQLQEPVYEQQ